MEDNKVLDKIKKLLALSKSPNEHEARAAMLKAQELMAKYGMSVEESVETEVTYTSTIAETFGNAAFRAPLGSIIAKNFRCEVFLSAGSIAFYGHSEDVPICKEVFEYAYRTIKKLGTKRYNEAKKAGYETRGFYTQYQTAFLIALKNAFEKQCTALMIVTPTDVTENFSKMSENWGHKKMSMQNRGINVRAYQQGTRDGKAFAETL